MSYALTKLKGDDFMADTECATPEKHYALHACQLKAKEMKKEIDEIFENPRYACTNCGVKVHNEENVCAPKEL
jgi:hypothetical protein